MGYAGSPETIDTLAGHGVRVSGYQWIWAMGLKGGTYPPHLDIDRSVEPFSTSFEAQPGEDWNGDSCTCAIVPLFRDKAGRFAKPGLTPIFQPPTL